MKVELTIDEIRRLTYQIEEEECKGLATLNKISWTGDQLLPYLEFKTIHNNIVFDIFAKYRRLLVAQYPEHIDQFRAWDFV